MGFENDDSNIGVGNVHNDKMKAYLEKFGKKVIPDELRNKLDQKNLVEKGKESISKFLSENNVQAVSKNSVTVEESEQSIRKIKDMLSFFNANEIEQITRKVNSNQGKIIDGIKRFTSDMSPVFAKKCEEFGTYFIQAINSKNFDFGNDGQLEKFAVKNTPPISFKDNSNSKSLRASTLK